MNNLETVGAWIEGGRGCKNSGGTILVANDFIYSYGQHHLLGVLDRRSEIALINKSYYSKTTSNHRYLCERVAYENNFNVINPNTLPPLTYADHKKNQDFFILEVERLVMMARRARLEHMVHMHLARADSVVTQYHRYSVAYGLRHRLDSISQIVSEANQTIKLGIIE